MRKAQGYRCESYRSRQGTEVLSVQEMRISSAFPCKLSGMRHAPGSGSGDEICAKYLTAAAGDFRDRVGVNAQGLAQSVERP